MSLRKTRFTKRYRTITIRNKLPETSHNDFKKTRNLTNKKKIGRYIRDGCQ